MIRSVRLVCLVLAMAIATTAILAACVQVEARDPSAIPSPTPVTEFTPTPSPSPTIDPSPTPTVTPTVAVSETPTPTPTATISLTPTQIPINNVGSFGLFLQIEGLGADSIVYGDTVLVRGQTAADAIVSINTVIVPVSADGTFEMTLRLVPGPNEIVVVASNLDGAFDDEIIDIVSLQESDGSV